MTIADQLSNNATFSIYTALLQQAGRFTLLQNASDLTVFAPTNLAFGRLAQQLGFAGDPTDEETVAPFLQTAFNSLTQGNPQSLLEAVLNAHVILGAQTLADLDGEDTVTTLFDLRFAREATGTVKVNGTAIRDAAVFLPDAVVETADLSADNGLIHVIDNVLIPVNIPLASGPADVNVLFGNVDVIAGDTTTADPVIDGGPGDDLLIANLFFDNMIGGPGNDVFVLGDAQSDRRLVDRVRDFEPGTATQHDRLDVSEFASSFADLTLTDLRDKTGAVKWVELGNSSDQPVAFLRFGDDTPLSSAALETRHFIFAEPETPIDPGALRLLDEPGETDLTVIGSGAVVYQMLDDNAVDLIRKFKDGTDLIDVSEFASSYADLTVTPRTNARGEVRYLEIQDAGGDLEILLKFAEGATVDPAKITADDFIFGPNGPVDYSILVDDEGPNGFGTSSGPTVYVLLDDDAQDVLRAFKDGIDRIDVSAIADDFDDLTITARVNRAGETRWLDIADDTGETELLVRFADGAAMDPGLLTAEDFLFTPFPLPDLG